MRKEPRDFRAIPGGRFRYRHEGFGFRVRHNRVRFPDLLIETVSDAFTRVASLFEGLIDLPGRPLEVLVRSESRPVAEPRAVYVPRRGRGTPFVYLNLFNRERFPLDSAYFWNLNRAILAHEFAHAWIDRRVGHRPLPEWIDEGTARFVERATVPRRPRGPEALDLDGPDRTLQAAHRAVEFLVGQYGLAAWLEGLDEVAGYLDRKRRRLRRALARSQATAEATEIRRRQVADMNRWIDRILSTRFGLDRGAISAHLDDPLHRRRCVESTDSPFDLLVHGRLDGAPAGSIEIAVGLRLSSAGTSTPVVTAIARRKPTVARLLTRARKRGLPVLDSLPLAVRLATGRRLHHPLPGPLGAAILAALASDPPVRSRDRADRLCLVRAGRAGSSIVAIVGDLVLYLGRCGRDRTNRIASMRRVGLLQDADLHRRMTERLVAGDALTGRLASRFRGESRPDDFQSPARR